MYIRVRTGGDLWGIIKTEDRETALRTAASCYAYARERWPNERTRIEGVTEEELKSIRKIAKAEFLNEDGQATEVSAGVS